MNKKTVAGVIISASLIFGVARASAAAQAQAAPQSGALEPADAAREIHRADRVGLGLEADVVPYAFGGAHLDAWAGRDGWRARAIAATGKDPAFLTPSGFKNLRTDFLEIEIDRFIGARAAQFRGPWIAAGGGAAHLTIDADNGSGRGSTTVPELSVGAGWIFSLPSNFYIDPWFGAGYQFTPGSIAVGTRTWHPQRVVPEIGLKIGWGPLL